LRIKGRNFQAFNSISGSGEPPWLIELTESIKIESKVKKKFFKLFSLKALSWFTGFLAFFFRLTSPEPEVSQF